jgi:hypothetical protein
MTYFADLSPYSFVKTASTGKALNVGWLSRWHSYPRGNVPEEVLAAIFALCQKPVNKTRGFHPCEFCSSKTMGTVVERDGIRQTLGSAEIRVIGPDGLVYAAPDLIYHYMRDHAYLPPKEFLEAAALSGAKS